MIHSFNTDLAEKFGIEKAILLDHICYWIAENERNEVNFIDGKTWVFNTAKALNEKFHYMSQRSLARYLDELERDGVLIVGNYCKNHFNRTKWYALSDKYMPLLNDYKSMSEIKNSQNNENIDIAKNEQSSCQNGNIIPTKNGKSSCQNGNSDDAKMSIQNCQNDKSEKYTNLYAKKNLQIPIPKEKMKKEKSQFIKPSLDEIKKFAYEADLKIDCERFFNYYESVGWLVGGKAKMRNWKCALRNWAKNERKFNGAHGNENRDDELLSEILEAEKSRNPIYAQAFETSGQRALRQYREQSEQGQSFNGHFGEAEQNYQTSGQISHGAQK